MITRTVRAGAVLAATCLLLSLLPAPGLAKGPGDPEAPLTLRLLVQDARGRQSEPAALDLQRLADELTDGAIRIEPTFGGGIDVLGPVADGEYELGMVPSRDAGDHDVTSLDVLEAPFLIDNDALALAVATSDIADRAMAGLDAIGVAGLAMWPEDLRHLFAMNPSGRTFLMPGDVADADVLAVAGLIGKELITTLGGRLYRDDGVAAGDLVGSKDADAQAGTLEGMITGLWGAGLPITTTTVAGDLVVFSKYQMLIANGDLLAGLTDRQRELLDLVVDAAHQAALDRHFSDRELAEALCASGHTVVEAGPEAIAAWRQAAQPLTDRLAADPLTAELMADVGYLAAEIAPSAGPGTCAPPDASAVQYPVSDTTGTLGTLPPDGQYRAEVTVDALVAAGADPDWAAANAGVMTWTYENGRVSTEVDGSGEVCQGRAVSRDGAFVSLITDPGQPCGLELSFVWRPAAGGLEFVLVAPEEPWEVQDFRNIQAHLEGRTWLRLDGPMPSIEVPSPQSAMPEPGVWRIEQTVDSLTAQGMSADHAQVLAGSITLGFDGTRWTMRHVWSGDIADCGGDYGLDDGLLVLHSDLSPIDCGTAPVRLVWTAGGDGTATVVLGEQLRVDAGERIFVGTWDRVGDVPQPSGDPAAFIGDRPPPAGTYRVNLTVDDLVAAGATRDFAGRNAGTWDWTFTEDAWSAIHGTEHCGAPMTVSDGHVELALNPFSESCTLAYDLRWRQEGDDLRFEVIDINWAEATPQILADERALIERVWIRVE